MATRRWFTVKRKGKPIFKVQACNAREVLDLIEHLGKKYDTIVPGKIVAGPSVHPRWR